LQKQSGEFMRIDERFSTKALTYLLAAGLNTICGYSLGVGLYLLLSETFHITVIAAISNFFAISVSFLTYKLFVFKTTGDWALEYFRSFILYGAMALFGILILWLFVDLFRIKIWWAQAFVISITALMSYFGHTHFTFRKR
jgi:putative flippase GtrA